MKAPLVSIVIPAYKAEKTLGQTLGSVGNQTFSDWEIVAVDDCSPDGTLPLLEAAARDDERIRVLRNTENSGVSCSRNRGVEAARGEWIAFLDSDDFWRPDKLEKQLPLTDRADMIYTGYDFVSGDGEKLPGVFHVPETTDFSAMLKKNVISTSGVLIRRELLREHPFRGDVAHEDLYEWLTLLKAGAKAAGIDEPLHTLRVSQRESRSGNKWRSARNRMRLYRQMGLSWPKAVGCWICYAWHGAGKYLALRRR